jgi:hypothetical protein
MNTIWQFSRFSKLESLLIQLRGLCRGLLFSALTLSGVPFVLSGTAEAQAIYTNTFNTDDSANWAVNFSYTSPAPFASISNTLYNFNFDYTTAGIPIAPHSALFGSAGIHHGLKMSACYTNPATLKGSAVTTGLSACPTNFSISQNFVMHADMWVNIDCTAYAATNTDFTSSSASFATSPHNSTASTVLYGCGYGTQGNVATTPGVTDAIWVGLLTDNGSSAQMRMYGPSTLGEASYQDGTYQSTGTTTPGFPGDPLVYNMGNTANGLGTRNMISSTGSPPYTPAQLSTNLATGVPWRNIFPSSPVPLAQQILYPQQTNNYSIPGFLAFKWHDVSVEKVGNVIIYKVDGNIIATGNYSSAGTPPGSFLTFVASRTGSGVASAASGVQYTNLNFVVFANIVVSNYDNVVNVSAPTPTCQEGIPGTPAVFDISRPSAGVPLTVSYTLTGTATNGVQYTTVPTTVTFASTATDTNIYIYPIDDGIPNPTATVILNLQSGAGYVGAGSAIVNILDGDTPTIDISGNSQAYGRYTNTASGYNDYMNFVLTRRGYLGGTDVNVNLAYSGSAVSGTDFTPVSSVTIPSGVQSVTNQIVPLDNPGVTTNRTVTVTVGSGGNYSIGNGSATGTVVSAHYAAPLAVLLSDDLTSSAASETNKWSILYGCGDPFDDSTDYEVNFGMPLASAAGSISVPLPPSGNANALHLTCNKDVTPGSPGAVNVYYTNLFLSGNYAVRFSMNLIQGQVTANNTEGVLFGINHTGTCSNWWYGSGFITNQTWASDGIWYYVTAQPGGSTAGDYQEFTGPGGVVSGVVTNTGWTRLASQTQTAFSQVFKDTSGSAGGGPFTCLDALSHSTAGVPAEGSPAVGYDASTWSDVEIKQLNGVVTMSINHTAIFVYTNTTVWTNGYLMLGYTDPYGSTIGTPEAGVYFANLQVVQLASSLPPVVTINSIAISGGNVVINFTTSSASDTTSSFTLFNSGTVNGTYGSISASITALGSNQFQATTPYVSGGQQFYRILHN